VAELTEKQVKSIIKTEIKKFIVDSFAKELKKELSDINSPARKEIADAIKGGISSLAKFLWLRRDVYTNEIK